MKRRIFVKLAAAGAVALYLPGLGCKSTHSALTTLLARPNALQHICDEETIRAIGKNYQKLAPGEDKEKLTNLLAAYVQDPAVETQADRALVSSTLAKRVTQDFQENRTIVVDGWILSVTEARQCALFSLTEN